MIRIDGTRIYVNVLNVQLLQGAMLDLARCCRDWIDAIPADVVV